MNLRSYDTRRPETLVALHETLAIAQVPDAFRVLGFDSEEQMHALSERAEQLLGTPIPILAVALALVPLDRHLEALNYANTPAEPSPAAEPDPYTIDVGPQFGYDDVTTAIGADAPTTDLRISDAALYPLPAPRSDRAAFYALPKVTREQLLQEGRDYIHAMTAGDDPSYTTPAQLRTLTLEPESGIGQALRWAILTQLPEEETPEPDVEHSSPLTPGVEYLPESGSAEHAAAVETALAADEVETVTPAEVVEAIDTLDEGDRAGVHGLLEHLGIPHNTVTIGDETVYQRSVSVEDFATEYTLTLSSPLSAESFQSGRIPVSFPALVGIPSIGRTQVEIVALYDDRTRGEVEVRLFDIAADGIEATGLRGGVFDLDVRNLLASAKGQVEILARLASSDGTLDIDGPLVKISDPWKRKQPAHADAFQLRPDDITPPTAPTGSLVIRPLECTSPRAARIAIEYRPDAEFKLKPGEWCMLNASAGDTDVQLCRLDFAGLSDIVHAAPEIPVPPHAFRDGETITTVTAHVVVYDRAGNQTAGQPARMNISREATS